jgi:hypothetical protein
MYYANIVLSSRLVYNQHCEGNSSANLNPQTYTNSSNTKCEKCHNIVGMNG